MADPVVFDFPLTDGMDPEVQDDVVADLTNGHLQAGLFKMGLFDSAGHLISEPLPPHDRDTGRSNIVRKLGYPGVQLKGCSLKVFGTVIAPRPEKGQNYAVTLKVSQGSNHVQQVSNGVFDEVAAVRFKVNFL